MSFYADMQATAARLIDQFGRDVVLVRESGGGIDPVTGAVTTGTDDSVTVRGIVRRYPNSLIDGTRIQATDREVVVEAKEQPLMTDRVRIDGKDYPVEEIQTTDPAGTPLVYFVRVRG